MSFNHIILTGITGIWLLLCSLQDFRKQKIHIGIISLGLISIVASFFLADISIWNRVIGLSLGVFILALNLITGGQIGVGDGLIVSMIGFGLGFHQLAVTLIIALFGAAVLAIGLIVFRKVGRKATIPFIPFVFLGFLGGLIG